MPTKETVRRREYQKKYYWKNRDKYRLNRAIWKANNKEWSEYKQAEWLKTPKGRYSILRRTAGYRKIPMDLTLEEFCDVITPEKCHYCKGDLPPTGHGVDRVDHFRGYTYDNCVACCASCNQRKGLLECAGFSYPRSVQLLKELLTGAGLQGNLNQVPPASPGTVAKEMKAAASAAPPAGQPSGGHPPIEDQPESPISQIPPVPGSPAEAGPSPHLM